MKRIHITNIDRYTLYNRDGSWFKYDMLFILTTQYYSNSKILIYFGYETNKCP